MNTIRLILKPGKERPLKGRHPWIFSGAIDKIDQDHKAGDLARVYSAADVYLGTGYLNPRSPITVRILTFADEPINREFFEKRIDQAIELRRRFMPEKTNAYRLIHSEGDFLPGLIVDRYADYLAVQFQTAGIEEWREDILSHLEARLKPKGIYEKGDPDMRGMEGLEKKTGCVRGVAPPEPVEIEEHGHTFLVDIPKGQKTGFFCDQRENRRMIQGLCRGKRVLNCFAYTGAFSVYAAKGGAASVVSVETSARALEICRLNFERNELRGPYEFIDEDVFEYLKAAKGEFDVIILDPPALAKSKDHVMRATRAYKDLSLRAMKQLAPGGVLYTASCSSYLDAALFQKVIFAAAKDAGREVQILAKTSHPPDHPINIFHPEGEYLKGLLCLVR